MLERDNEISILVKLLKQHAKRANLRLDEMCQLQTNKNKKKEHETIHQLISDESCSETTDNSNQNDAENINPNLLKLNIKSVQKKEFSVTHFTNIYSFSLYKFFSTLTMFSFLSEISC